MDILHLKKRMLLIKPEATCRITMDSSDLVTLGWDWEEKDSDCTMIYRAYDFTIEVDLIDIRYRKFEHMMHKATRVIRHGRRADGQ
jgi:hypothetical protein